MSRKELLNFFDGFRHFKKKYFEPDDSPYRSSLANGQAPKTLIIGCSDARVDPAIIASASPGELFVIRNVANLVPPFESSRSGLHGVSAAIEFAVVNLKVENIVILGHRQCGGIRALMTRNESSESSFVDRWMAIAQPAKERVLLKLAKADIETQCHDCEMESIVVSINNLRSFPFIRKAVQDGVLTITGLYFDLESGQLFEYEEDRLSFQAVEF